MESAKTLRIGILLCDDCYPEFIPEYGYYDDFFIRALLPQPSQPGITTPNIEFQAWRCHLDQFPDGAEQCDAWLVSGSKWSAYEDIPWLTQLTTLIQSIDKQRKKLIGICFGHQMIHQALGGKVSKSPNGWGLGFYDIHLTRKFNPFNPQDSIRVLAMHQDQVQELAPEFQTLAGSDFCPHAMTIKEEHILTFQPHPEFSPEFFSKLCEYVRDGAGDKKVEMAQKQAREEGDGDRFKINQIILNFILNQTHKDN